jgi:hypothetical protein
LLVETLGLSFWRVKEHSSLIWNSNKNINLHHSGET